jgi:hypothetical protein
MGKTLDERKLAAYIKAIGLDKHVPTWEERSARISERRLAEFRSACMFEAERAGHEENLPVEDMVRIGMEIKRQRKMVQQAMSKGLHSRRLREAMPAWADRDEIAKVYGLAKEATIQTGEPHEVDHIVPLLGVGVCGLHVSWNLRVTTRSVNRRKSNNMNARHR